MSIKHNLIHIIRHLTSVRLSSFIKCFSHTYTSTLGWIREGPCKVVLKFNGQIGTTIKSLNLLFPHHGNIAVSLELFLQCRHGAPVDATDLVEGDEPRVDFAAICGDAVCAEPVSSLAVHCYRILKQDRFYFIMLK